MTTPNPAILYVKIRTQIQGLAGLTVFDGQVPSKVPTDAGGYILPYVAIFAGIGEDLPEERSLTQLVDMDVLDWRFQTTCVGASANIAMSVAHSVRLALSNLPVGGGFVKPDTDGFTAGVPLSDNQVTPARFFLPLMWRLITN